MNVPQHPGRAQEAGLEPQTQQGNSNPYFRPSIALTAANEGIQQQVQQAQAEQAYAQAGKAQAEAAIMQQQAGLGNPVEAGPTVQPQQVQAEQIAEGIINGQVSQEQLQQMIQAGELDPTVAQAAVGMAQQFMQEDAVRNQQIMQQQGLGRI